MSLRAAIVAEIQRRKRRTKFLPGDLLREPAWDLLLDLALSRIDGKRINFNSACIATGAPITTGRRWIALLVGAGLVETTGGRERDGRLRIVTITDAGMDAVAACFGEMSLRAVAA